MFKRLFKRGEDSQDGLQLEELEREGEGEPRGGLQSQEYRSADPRDIVEEDGVAMSGPAGAPQEGESVEQRRERDRSF
jgi:hypothetical protein